MDKMVHHPLYGLLTDEEANVLLRLEYGEKAKIERRIADLESLIREAA